MALARFSLLAAASLAQADDKELVIAVAGPITGQYATFGDQMRRGAEADGSGWPAGLAAEYIDRSKLDWHMFPNTVYLHGFVDGEVGRGLQQGERTVHDETRERCETSRTILRAYALTTFSQPDLRFFVALRVSSTMRLCWTMKS